MRHDVSSIVDSAASALSGGQSSSRRPSDRELERQAREFAPILGQPWEDIFSRLKAHWDEETKELVVIYRFGSGDDDFTTSQVLADMLADERSPGSKAKKGFAWKDQETGKLTAASATDLLRFQSEHPGFEFPKPEE